MNLWLLFILLNIDISMKNIEKWKLQYAIHIINAFYAKMKAKSNISIIVEYMKNKNKNNNLKEVQSKEHRKYNTISSHEINNIK